MATHQQKLAIRQQIDNFIKQGGDFAFVFGDIRLPVEYNEALGTLHVNVKDKKVSLVVNYNIDLQDNMNDLMEHLLTEYPELTD